MSVAHDAGSVAEAIERDSGAWDVAVMANHGHLLQSWRWGAFKEKFGWQVERFAVPGEAGMALAQVLFRHKAGVSIGYIPRGPVLASDDHEASCALWDRIDRSARRRRALSIIVEPDTETAALAMTHLSLAPGPVPRQPARTVKVALLDDDALMAQMHSKTRYNVRMARRREVAVWAASDVAASVETFYELLKDTASRNTFGVHAADYYRQFLHLFGDDTILLLAGVEQQTAAGVIAVKFGDEAIYMYGASSTKDRANGAGFLLQHEAMRWARDRGATRYDMWGIPEFDPASTVSESGDRLVGSTGADMRGLYEFKTRFGGEIVRYPAPLERRYHPVLASLAKRLYGASSAG